MCFKALGAQELWYSGQNSPNLIVCDVAVLWMSMFCWSLYAWRIFYSCWAVVCEDRSKASHPSVREGRMNWGLEKKRPEYATSLNTENTAEKFRTKGVTLGHWKIWRYEHQYQNINALMREGLISAKFCVGNMRCAHNVFEYYETFPCESAVLAVNWKLLIWWQENSS